MMFNTIVNVGIIIGGIVEFLGIAGGLSFLAYSLWEAYSDRKQSRCQSCANYEPCSEVMEDTLPGSCAYWEKKKP